ncbi:hypothetical protein [Streptosporangium sp. NPDC006007]|uniref:hypothetical protein n=1 Tax=Streptosporangium sp. NPDC006007 TaxID=3154575 RepID=UPI0033AD14AC
MSPTRLIVGPEELGRVQTFQVQNGGRLPVDVVVNRASFTVSEDGRMVLDEDAPHSAAEWVEVSPAKFHLIPGERRPVAVRIDPPANRGNGEHEVAVLFVAPPGPRAAGENIKINRAIGAPIYITVPGPIDTSLRLGDLSSPGFVMSGPVDFGVTVDNVGTVHRDFFGRDGLSVEVDGRKVPFPDFTVLRGTSRNVAVRWTDPPLMCVCHPRVSIPGPDGPSSRSATVVIFPLHLFALMIGLALVLHHLVRLARRRYRAHVLDAARGLRGDGESDLRPGGEA